MITTTIVLGVDDDVEHVTFEFFVDGHSIAGFMLDRSMAENHAKNILKYANLLKPPPSIVLKKDM